MKRFLHIFFALLVCGLIISGCSPLEGIRDKVVARVDKQKLRLSEVNLALPAGATPEDSLALLSDYLEAWARKEVKMQEAERVLGQAAVDEVERMVEEYRQSLLGYRLDQYYLGRKVDTLLSDSVVTAYWDEHRADFALDRTVVKGRIVRVPNSYRQAVRLLSLMRSSSEDRQQDFLSTCEKNNFELHIFEDSWVDFSEFLSYLPVRRDRSYDYMLDSREVREMADADNRYFVQITDYLKEGSDAPFDRVGDAVRRIIFNRRRNEVIRNYEDSLYSASLLDGRVELLIDELESVKEHATAVEDELTLDLGIEVFPDKGVDSIEVNVPEPAEGDSAAAESGEQPTTVE